MVSNRFCRMQSLGFISSHLISHPQLVFYCRIPLVPRPCAAAKPPPYPMPEPHCTIPIVYLIFFIFLHASLHEVRRHRPGNGWRATWQKKKFLTNHFTINLVCHLLNSSSGVVPWGQATSPRWWRLIWCPRSLLEWWSVSQLYCMPCLCANSKRSCFMRSESWTDESLNVAPETPPFLHGTWRAGGMPTTPPELFATPGTPPGHPPTTWYPACASASYATGSFSQVAGWLGLGYIQAWFRFYLGLD